MNLKQYIRSAVNKTIRKFSDAGLLDEAKRVASSISRLGSICVQQSKKLEYDLDDPDETSPFNVEWHVKQIQKEVSDSIRFASQNRFKEAVSSADEAAALCEGIGYIMKRTTQVKQIDTLGHKFLNIMVQLSKQSN